MARTAHIVVALLGLETAVQAQPPARVVVLPFENLSGNATVARDLSSYSAKVIPARGWRLADPVNVEAVLEDERIRYLDSLTPKQLARILDATGAETALLGSVYTYEDGANPSVAVAMQLVDRTGRIRWWDIEARTAGDTVGVLGLGRVDTAAALARDVVHDLVGRAPSPGHFQEISGPGTPRFLGEPITWRSPYLPRDDHYRVVILPLEGWVGSGGVAKIVATLLARRLEATGHFHVVEPAVVRRALLDLGLWSVAALDPDALRRLGEKVDAPYFVRGTLFQFMDGRGQSSTPPRVELMLTMIDARRERIVWIGEHARVGDDYQGLLELGGVSTAVALADRVVGELVEASEKAADPGPALKKVRPLAVSPASQKAREAEAEAKAKAGPKQLKKLTPEQQATARSLVQKAMQASDAGRADEALASLKKALDVTEDARLFFFEGQIQDRAGRTKAAIAAYKRYVAEANVGSAQKAPVQNQIKALEARAAQEAEEAKEKAAQDNPTDETPPAEAQPAAAPESQPVEVEPAGPKLSDRQQRKLAERLDAADRAEKAKKYDEALTELRSAYLVTHDPALLARMAVDAERAGHADQAAEIRAEMEALTTEKKDGP